MPRWILLCSTLDMILTLLSAIFGGMLRLLPEVLKFLGQGQQNNHELSMQDKQLEFLRVQGQLKTEEIAAQGRVDLQKSQNEAVVQVNQIQASESAAGGWMIAAINALVRPTITFFMFGMWGVHRLALMLFAFHITGDSTQVLMNAWTADDAAMLSMIASFYFVGRVLDKAA